jgi:hypothetical protein
MRKGFVLAVVVGTAACGSLFAGTDTEVGSGDGGLEASSEPSDAGLSDGGPPDAGPSDAADARFCSTVDAQFCWSFDEGPLPLTGPLLVPAGPAPTVGDAALSPPGAMVAALSDVGFTGVRLAVTDVVSVLRCDADLFFETADSGASDEVTILQHDWDGSYFDLPYMYARQQGNGALRVGIQFLSAPQVADLGNAPMNQWVHVFLQSALVDGQWVITGQVIGAPVGLVDAGPRAALPQFTKLFFGVASLKAVTWTVRYDNLVCRWQ